MLRLFRYLGPEVLCRCSQVCSSWSELAKTSSLWRHLYPVRWARGTVDCWKEQCSVYSIVFAILNHIYLTIMKVRFVSLMLCSKVIITVVRREIWTRSQMRSGWRVGRMRVEHIRNGTRMLMLMSLVRFCLISKETQRNVPFLVLNPLTLPLASY